MMRERQYVVLVRGFSPMRVWGQTRHKAKATVARELVEHGHAYDFKHACNRLIYSCRLVQP
ncbi:hypothetical protein [Sphingomonas segetis]|jgi:hypothetical protein|uniref:hypothetical protein n=1 Tax=Sphingomonas segetis TaxID=1104779 RepID=UPI0012D36C58|nr:hypothetical protein [Sphingomonas segetis]